MKYVKQIVLALAGVLTSLAAFGDVWVQGEITGVDVIGNEVRVWGNFTPSQGCINNAFVLYATDPDFRQSYALILSAQAQGVPVRFLHSYCQSNGLARGNGYGLVPR